MTSLWLNERAPISTASTDRREFDEVVVGAGITGLSTAVMLARRGRSVAVLEAKFPGALATGNTTAKVSVLQGTRLSSISKHHPDSLVAAYALSNLEGQAWLLDFCRSAGVPFEVRSAVTYASTPDATAAVTAEYDVSRRIGLDVEYRQSVDLPYPTFGAVEMREQFQLDPIELLTALAAELESLGGVIVSGVTVTGVRAGEPVELETTGGFFSGEHVVLATGTPFLDRGLYFAKTSPHRSYALAFETDDDVPIDMYLSADSPTRSLRTAEVGGRRYLIVGGNGHVVGRHPSPALLVADLEHWTYRHFPGAKLAFSWSAQDYHSDDEVPFVGLLPRGKGRVWFATGFDKWGMTNGPAAALRITAEIMGDETLRWAKVIGRRLTVPADLGEGIVAGLGVAKSVVTGWLGATRKDVELPAVGQGVVGKSDGRPVAVSNVDGAVCAVSAICTHLGGIVSWNDSEKSWDCPLHGSRFSADGVRIEGPAVRDLAREPRLP